MKFHHQFDESDCGPACLAMIASCYDSRWTITKIRDIAGTDKSGTNLNGMVGAAKKMGFEVAAVKNPGKVLSSTVPVPFIAHLENKDGGTHFVVITKVAKDWIWIADPASKKKKLSRLTFMDCWSGYALFLNTTPKFEPVKNAKGMLLKYLPLLRPHLSSRNGSSQWPSVLVHLLSLLWCRYNTQKRSLCGTG